MSGLPKTTIKGSVEMTAEAKELDKVMKQMQQIGISVEHY